MRITRLRLANYRGVRSFEARLPVRGLCVVLGDNETGKSSLAEAIDLLFEFPDDSRHKDVLAAKPVHRDAGAEVEADVVAGPFSFTYRKRFHVSPRTELIVHTPAPENRTGRDAHDRVRTILRDSVDLDLWRALRVPQGEIGTQPELTAAPSLAQALASSAQQAHAREEDLLAAVRRERERYFTPSGERKRVLIEAEGKLQRLRDEVAALAKSAEEVAADAERVEQLMARLAEQSAQRESALGSVGALQREAEAARARDAALAAAASARSIAEARIRQAEHLIRTLQDGAELPAQVAAASAARGHCAQAAATAQAELAAAQAQLAECSAALQRARAARDAAAAGARLRDSERALAQWRALRAELQGQAQLDQAAVDQLAALQSAFEAAKARQAAQAASVTLRAHRDLHGSSSQPDRTELRLAAGERAEFVVTDALQLRFHDLDLEVRAGEAASALAAAVVSTGAAWRDALQRLACRDLAHARELLAARREQQQASAERLGELKALLGESDPSRFDAALAKLRDAAAGHERQPVAGDPAALEQQAGEAAARQRRAQRAALDAQAALDRAQSAEHEAHNRLAANRAAQAAFAASLPATDLTSAQAVLTDAARALRQAQDDDLRARSATSRAVLAIERELQAQQQRAANLDAQIQTDREALTALRTKLSVRGEDGVAERLGRAEAELARQAQSCERDRRRAAAVEALYGALLAARDRCVQAYHLPIKHGIEQLGRAVFGATFQVTLDERLQVAQRTLHGVTVPFRELSLGAREQIAILLRLACALAVAPRAGVPVLLDDALGQSDPDRLKAMGHALQLAGERCQVILLTCAPQRAQWAAAHVIRMPPRSASGEAEAEQSAG